MYRMRITASGKIKNIKVAACNSGLVTCWISIGNPQYADSSKQFPEPVKLNKKWYFTGISCKNTDFPEDKKTVNSNALKLSNKSYIY